MSFKEFCEKILNIKLTKLQEEWIEEFREFKGHFGMKVEVDKTLKENEWRFLNEQKYV